MVAKVTTSAPTVSLRLPGANQQYRLTCRVQTGPTTLGTVALDQDTVARDPRIPAPMIDQEAAATAELMTDFRGYVIEAAAGTGANGITSLFLASLLRNEIANTPPLPGQSPRAARERELARSDAAVRERERGGAPEADVLNASIGVGQIKPSTAATVTGATPWVEQDRNDREPGRRRALANYLGLSPAQQREILTLLAWPRGNITTAARLLARLKNRSNRYPGLTQAAFGANERAVKIVATEYNIGASTTHEALAQPSTYGDTVWTNMQDPLMRQFFP
ncbi:hypothetical protein GCM10010193_24370 [Kitasatospora atroaurantiaca]